MIAKASHARRALLVVPNSQPCLLNNRYHDSSQLCAQFLGEEDLFLRFQEADLFQMRAMSKRKHQQSLSSFSRPKTLDLRFFSSPCSLCARLLLSRTSRRMARSWFARALSVAQRFGKKKKRRRRNDYGTCQGKEIIKTRLCWLLFGRLLAHKINSILSLLND